MSAKDNSTRRSQHRAQTRSVRFPNSRATGWEVYNTDKADPIPDEEKSPWELIQGERSSTVSRIKRKLESFKDVQAASPRRPHLPHLSLSAIQSTSVSPGTAVLPATDYNAPPGDEESYETSSEKTPRRAGDYQISCIGSDVANTEDINDAPEDGVPAHLKMQDSFGTRASLVELRTLLMRCQVLQATMNNVERKPWKHYAKAAPYPHYSKMRKIAYRARKVAERLESSELQARCEYWAGRGCGGMKDWGAAADHFASAMQLDVENDTYPSGRTRLRGLRPNEKEDVEILQRDASQRHKNSLKNKPKAQPLAQIEHEKIVIPMETFVDWSDIPSSSRQPKQDRVVRLATIPGPVPFEEDAEAKFSEEAFRLEERMLRDLHDGELRRRKLSRAEMQYIQHGHKTDVIRCRREERVVVSRGSEATNAFRDRTDVSRSTSRSSQSPMAPQGSATRPLTLQEELVSAMRDEE